MKRFQADITCGEMALATHLLEGKPSEWALLKRHADEDVFGIQLAAGYADQYTRTMELVQNHLSVDFVDLNLGCPLDMVCNKGSYGERLTCNTVCIASISVPVQYRKY
jgi:tRNA-dihydrouridine synthase 3